MKSKRCLIVLLTVCAMVMTAGGALAHDLWLSPQSYNPQVGETLKVLVGFGHKFPASRVDEKVRPNFLQPLTAIAPDGKVIQLEKKSEDEYALPVSAQGPYLIRAQIKPCFYCRVAGKMKPGNKKDLGKVDTCMFISMVASAPVFAGADAKNPAAPPASQPLQVLPLGDVAKLKKGDTLQVKVLFKGAPLTKTKLRATYAGYKPPKQEPFKPDPKLSPREAARQKMMRKMAALFPVRVETDAQGVAPIKLSAPGWWLILLNHNTPHQDAAVCDKNIYKVSYTFEVK